MKRFCLPLLLLASCAPSGPWPISTEAERDERLPKVGMTSGEVWGKLGQAMRAPNDFVASFLPGPGYDGLAYYQIKGLTLRVAEVRFEAGVVKDVRYVPRRPAATATSGVMYADGEASEEPPSNVVTFARTCTWDGGGVDALASNAVNWDTDTAPVAGDSIVFPTTTKACTWDLNLSLVAFTVNAGYVQTITQNSGANFTFSGAFAVNGACTITCNAGATTTTGAFSVAAGTFNQGGAFVSTTFGVTSTGIYTGSSATMSTTAVTHSNTATITATSGIWSVAGSWTKNNSPTFTHNSGTINITAASTFSPAATLNLVTINATNVSITISSGTTCPLGATPTTNDGTGTVTVAGVVTWTGLWTHTGSLTVTGTLTGTSTPTLAVNQNITTSGATITNAIGTVTFNGTTVSTYTDTTAALTASTFVITKSGNANVTVAASTTMALGAAPTSTVGTQTITVTGTLSWSGLWTITGSLTATGTLTGTGTPTIAINQSLTTSSATITNAIGTITFVGTTASTYTDTGDKLSGTTFVITKTGIANATVAASTIMRLGASPTSTMLASTSTLTVTGTVNVSGTWTLTGGALTVGATGTVSGALTALTITKNFTVTAGGVFPASVVLTLASTSGSQSVDAAGITFATSFISQGSGGAATIANGTTFPLGASPTTATGTGILTVNGILTVSGTWTHTGSLTVGAAGTVSGALTNLTIDRNFTITAGGVFPAATLSLTTGTTAQSIDASGFTFSTTITKTAGTITVFSGTTLALGASPAVSLGTSALTANGTVTASGTITMGGTFNVGATGTLSGGTTAISITDGDWNANAAATIPAAYIVTLNNTTRANAFFVGGSKSYGAVRFAVSIAGTTQVSGSNTFTSFRDNDGTVAHTVSFTAGTTQTITGASTFQYVIDGGFGVNTVTLASTVPTSAFTLAFTGGKPVNLRNCAISDMTTSGAEVWAGPNCTDGTGNTGTIKFAVNPRLRKQ